MLAFDSVIDSVMAFDFDDRNEIIEILNNRQSQEWRRDTAEYYRDLKANISAETSAPMSANEAIKELHRFIESD